MSILGCIILKKYFTPPGGSTDIGPYMSVSEMSVLRFVPPAASACRGDTQNTLRITCIRFTLVDVSLLHVLATDTKLAPLISMHDLTRLCWHFLMFLKWQAMRFSEMIHLAHKITPIGHWYSVNEFASSRIACLFTWLSLSYYICRLYVNTFASSTDFAAEKNIW